MSSGRSTADVRRIYARVAPHYDRRNSRVERIFAIRPGRVWACGGATGEVLEIAVGTGRNLDLYPDGVTLTAIDLSAEMLGIARQRAAALGRSVDVREADATALPFADDSFDTVVCTLSLCTIPDPVAAAKEAVRVCRPGGELRFFEHGLGSNRFVAAGERLLEPLFLRLEADRLTLRADEVLRDGGAEVVEVRRYNAGIFWRVLARPAAA